MLINIWLKTKFVTFLLDLSLLFSIHNRLPGQQWSSFPRHSPIDSNVECSNACSSLINCLSNGEEAEIKTQNLQDDLRQLQLSLNLCGHVSQHLKNLTHAVESKTSDVEIRSLLQQETKFVENFVVSVTRATKELPHELQRISMGARTLVIRLNSGGLSDILSSLVTTSENLKILKETKERDLVLREENLRIQQRQLEQSRQSHADNSASEKLNQLRSYERNVEETWLKVTKEQESLKHKTADLMVERGRLEQLQSDIEKRNKESRKINEDLKTQRVLLAEKETNNTVQKALLDTQQREIERKQSQMAQEREQFEKDRAKVNLVVRLLVILVLGIIVYKFISMSKGRTVGIAHQVRRAPANVPETLLDLCHLSLTRERNIFFENTLLPKLEENNVRPRMETRILTRPSDFDNIPPAKCYIVHWTSQRMSIFSSNWSHQGLLRALGQSPVMILVYDSERIETLPPGETFDRSFRQIETERELVDAAREQRLITYRANERFNDSQYQTLRNWVNANIGDP